jgi:arginyl-tRNA synthetase
LKEISKDKDLLAYFSRIEEKNGFLNFFFKKEALFDLLLQDEVLPKKLSGQKIVLEFGDPNPFKDLHIGHLRILTLGESFARLLEALGGRVIRANYQGDVGMHVAKAIYGIKRRRDEFLELEKSGDEVQRAYFLGSCYAQGAADFESSETAKRQIQEINKKIYQQDEDIRRIWEIGRQWSLDYFETIYSRLGIKYDVYYFENQTEPLGRALVLEKAKEGIFEEDQGAFIFRGERFGLHTRVFITKEGYATYEAKDLALARLKEKDFGADRYFIITGKEQSEYFSVVLAALHVVEPQIAKKTKHYSLGSVGLVGQKMSSRLGNVVRADWLLSEIKRRLKETFANISDEALERVGVGAAKYSMLKFSREKDIEFSFEESISLEGNSGPYLQYSFVRAKSVLDKKSIDRKIFASSLDANSELDAEEELLLRALCRFAYIVEEAAEEFLPNLLCNYLFDLAKIFNLFYQKKRIIGGEKEDLRLFLTQVFKERMSLGLSLLGIQTPEKM